MSSDTATASLLWAACRPEPDVAAMASAVVAGADLGHAGRVALHQRVGPLLLRALESCESVPNDCDWARELRLDAMRWRINAMHALPRLLRSALSPLHAAGLEPLVVKGAALAERYPDPRLRPMEDVDIILPAAQHPDAIAVLQRAGWTQLPRPGTHYDVLLAHPDVPGLPLELHHALATWRDASNGLSSGELWSRRRHQVIQGVDAFGLDPEDELVLVASHAGKPYHLFSRLVWFVDVVVIVQAAAATTRPIDWHRVVTVAEKASCQTALAVALEQASRLGAPSPAFARQLPASSARRAALEPVLSAEWPLRDPFTGTRTLRHALIDSRRHQLAQLASAVTARGPRGVPRVAIETAHGAVRRWRQLRRSGVS